MKTEQIKNIIKYLLQQEGFTTIAKLADFLGCSQRTIHNYLNSSQFDNLILHCNLERIPNKGIKIVANTKTKNQILSNLKREDEYNVKYQDDFTQVLLSLLTSSKTLNITDISESLYRSANSVYLLIKSLNEELSKYKCNIKNSKTNGLLLEGTEKNIRELFFKVLDETRGPYTIEFNIPRITPTVDDALCRFLNNEESDDLIRILDMSEKMIGLDYCDEDYNMLLLHLIIIIIRSRLHCKIEDSIIESKDLVQEYYCATLIKCYLEKDFQIEIDEGEVHYISLLLASTRKKINPVSGNIEIDILDKFLNLLGIRLNMDLSNDYELRHNLMLHLRPAIKRMRQGTPNKNPLLEQVRMEYTEVYISVITAIEELEKMENIYFDSNELGYICLHIIAAINRPNNIKKINSLLICTEGLSIEIFLKNLIESYFKEIEITEIHREQISIHPTLIQKYDLIIDTTKTCKQGNAVQISTSFNSSDLDTIRHYLNGIGKLFKTKLNESFKFLSFFKDDVPNQEVLINKYCDCLKQGGYVKENFYESVINRTKISSTYVARGIAVPHGSKEEVISSIIFAISLENPIEWDGEKCDFVILVALNEENSNETNVLFRKIMKIAASNTLAHELKKCVSLEDMIQLLNQ